MIITLPILLAPYAQTEISSLPALDSTYAAHYKFLKDCDYFEGTYVRSRVVPSKSWFNDHNLQGRIFQINQENMIDYTIIETFRINGSNVDVYANYGSIPELGLNKPMGSQLALRPGTTYIIVGKEFDGVKLDKTLFKISDIQLQSTAGITQRKIASGYRCRKAISKKVNNYQDYAQNLFALAAQGGYDASESKKILKRMQLNTFSAYGSGAAVDYAYTRYQFPIWLTDLAKKTKDADERFELLMNAYRFGGYSYLPQLFDELLNYPVLVANIKSNKRYSHLSIRYPIIDTFSSYDAKFKLKAVNGYRPKKDKQRYWNYLKAAKTDFQKLFIVNNMPFEYSQEDEENWVEFILKEPDQDVLNLLFEHDSPIGSNLGVRTTGGSIREQMRKKHPKIAERLGIRSSFDE